MSTLELAESHACFGGEQRFYTLNSKQLGLPARFSVYLPPAALRGETCRAVMYLAGLTCTEETAVVKAGAQRVAAQLNLVLIFPDTSPRGANVPGEDDSWDFGSAAGFYLDATRDPWAKHYRMESFLIRELLPMVCAECSVDANRVGLTGHSMGGHGALTLAQKHPGMFKSLSAFAPICAPSQCAWGHKALGGYLGDDKAAWKAHDATELMKAQTSAPYPEGILIDQGKADQFLQDQLLPECFQAACEQVGQPLTLRVHEGYNHSYYFVSTFMEDHLRFHADKL
ncbi:MAG: S-formylglutathione hydrolase [Limnobacter sp.]|nr:S-formylglutathione hydrolase [Limnobacter sp.]